MVLKTIVATHNPDLARDFDRELLSRRDLCLVTARTVAELVESLRAGAQLCFIDRMLPDCDAETALVMIRADKRLGAIPAVMVTSEGAPTDLARAREHGFADVVELPAEPGRLSTLVAALLGEPVRGDERVGVRFDVHSLEAGGERYLGAAVDLSEAGVLVRSPRRAEVGATPLVRFVLPGAPGALRLRAKVVRVDERELAPAHAVALSFEELTPLELETLRNYLELAGDRPLAWRISDGGRVVSLYGVLAADQDLGELARLAGPVEFRMRELRIGSDSVQRWIDFVRALAAAPIRLVECPVSFVHQANQIINLLDRQEVISFYAPYGCARCGVDQEVLIEVARLGTERTPPAFGCPSCGGPLAFDGPTEQYFSFLTR
jgi:CheY-like chemotaxis protein